MNKEFNTLNIELKNIRGIKHLSVSLDFAPGVYAIAGENASGKSTLLAALSGLFYSAVFSRLLITKEKSLITYELGDSKTIIFKSQIDRWSRNLGGRFVNWANPRGQMWQHEVKINGFYEGSVIHGNRFRDVNYPSLFQSKKIEQNRLVEASDFVRENLGFIIRNDKSYYDNLFFLSEEDANIDFSFKGTPYFLIIDSEKNLYPIDEVVSQFSLSTGENLMISLLNSIYQYVIQRPESKNLYVVLLDEIELGLHPSALTRLLKLLKTLSQENNVIIYLSTHSMELIRNIDPKNIFFLKKKVDLCVDVVNPCFPAYATRNIYEHDGYDLLILVEDKLAKILVRDLLIKGELNYSKLIHVLPVGGWTNVLDLHEEVLRSNLLGSDARVLSILDGDVKQKFNSQKSKGVYTNLDVTFLPIESLEKYLHYKIIGTADDGFIKLLGDNLFTQTSLLEVIAQYSAQYSDEDPEKTKDKSRKRLFEKLIGELESINRTEDDLMRMVSSYIIDSEDIKSLVDRIKRALE